MQMQEKGCKDLTLEQIVNKMKKLRQKYKTEKDKTRKTGNSKKKKWKYFDQIDNFMSQKHNVTPFAMIDTMDQSDKENESAIGIFYMNFIYCSTSLVLNDTKNTSRKAILKAWRVRFYLLILQG